MLDRVFVDGFIEFLVWVLILALMGSLCVFMCFVRCAELVSLWGTTEVQGSVYQNPTKPIFFSYDPELLRL